MSRIRIVCSLCDGKKRITPECKHTTYFTYDENTMVSEVYTAGYTIGIVPKRKKPKYKYSKKLSPSRSKKETR